MQSSTFTVQTLSRVAPLLSKLAVTQPEKDYAEIAGKQAAWLKARSAHSVGLEAEAAALVHRAVAMLDQASKTIGAAA